MRIGMMVDRYKPYMSGVTNYVALNKRVLEEAGHEVFVFTFGDLDYPLDEINIFRSPNLPLLDKIYTFNLRYNRKAQRLLQTMDIVHVMHPFISGPLAIEYCRPKHIPIVFTNHTRYDIYMGAYVPILSFLGGWLMRGYLPIFCRYVDRVISPSPGMRDLLVKFGVDVPIEVIPNGIDLQPFYAHAEPFERSSFGFSNEDVLLVYVGRLAPEKNLTFLLTAFGAVAQTAPKCGLLLIGDGLEKVQLQSFVKINGLSDRVHFTGLVPYDMMPRYLAMADAFVTASVSEVHPFTVIEAMAAGLPILGIQSPGVGDSVQDCESGYICASEDLLEFQTKMVRLISDGEQRRKMGESARKNSAQYAIEHTTQMIIDCYQSLIDESAERWAPKTSRRTKLSRQL